MDKIARARYLNDLLGLMESKDSAGRPRGTALTDEYNRNYNLLIEDIRKDQEDETRKRESHKGTESGAKVSRG